MDNNCTLQIENCKLKNSPSLLFSLGGEGDEGCLGHWDFGFGIYLGFGIWRLGFLVLGFLTFLALISSMVSCQRQQAGITVAGSTSVEPFAEMLAEEFMLKHPQSHIYVKGMIDRGDRGGTNPRSKHWYVFSFFNGWREKPPCSDDRSGCHCRHRPSKNPVPDLSLTQIRQVFSRKIRSWKEVGGNPHPIVLVTREGGIWDTGGLSEVGDEHGGDQS